MNEETIPEDIQKKVGEVLGPPGVRVHSNAYDLTPLFVGLAIAAERERCAKVADAHKRVQTTLSGPGAAKLTAQSIAFDIRHPA